MTFGQILPSKRWDLVGWKVTYISLPCLAYRQREGVNQARQKPRLHPPLLLSSSPPLRNLPQLLLCGEEKKSMTVDAEAQFHVLAVDDSLMDRKLIERLLKTSSFQGTKTSNP